MAQKAVGGRAMYVTALPATTHNNPRRNMTGWVAVWSVE
jgi:hypothetical protein